MSIDVYSSQRVVVPPCRRMLSRCVHLTARKSPYTGARGADYKSDEKSSGSCARGTRANCSVSLPSLPLRAYNDGARGVVAEERNAVQLQPSGGPPRRYRAATAAAAAKCRPMTRTEFGGFRHRGNDAGNKLRPPPRRGGALEGFIVARQRVMKNPTTRFCEIARSSRSGIHDP